MTRKKTLLALLISVCVGISFIGAIDDKTTNYVDDAVIKATAAYASARALNAVISVAQSTQIGVSLGVEGSFQPLEILDPVNDMVEDYATVMKFSIGSLLIQKLLAEIMACNAFKWLLLGLGGLLIINLFLFDKLSVSVLFKSFIFVCLLRFMFILVILMGNWIDGAFLHDKIETQVSLIDKTTDAIKFQNESSPEKNHVNDQRNILKIQAELRTKIDKQERVVDAAEEQRELFEKELRSFDNEKSFVEKWNPLNDDSPKIIAVKAELKNAKENFTEEYEYLVNLRDQLEKQDDALAEITGETRLFSDIKDKLYSFYSMFNAPEIISLLKNSINAMLNLIALFVFKTMILPVAFLYVILQIFKLLWGIDLRTKDGTFFT